MRQMTIAHNAQGQQQCPLFGPIIIACYGRKTGIGYVNNTMPCFSDVHFVKETTPFTLLTIQCLADVHFVKEMIPAHIDPIHCHANDHFVKEITPAHIATNTMPCLADIHFVK